MIDIIIDNNYDDLIIENLLIKAAKATLKNQHINQANLTLVITSDERLKKLNLEYRQINKSTDVLSFPAELQDPESGELYLGDVIIAYPTAALQAKLGGHPAAEELQLLVVHGVLHLLGHDHYEADDKKTMWAAQAAILTNLGVSARPND